MKNILFDNHISSVCKLFIYPYFLLSFIIPLPNWAVVRRTGAEKASGSRQNSVHVMRHPQWVGEDRDDSSTRETGFVFGRSKPRRAAEARGSTVGLWFEVPQPPFLSGYESRRGRRRTPRRRRPRRWTHTFSAESGKAIPRESVVLRCPLTLLEEVDGSERTG